MLAGVLLFNVHTETLKSQTVPPTITEDVTIEHTAPVTLTVLASAGKSDGIIEFHTDGEETVTLTVPTSWQRREVRGAALETVTADPLSVTGTRWHLPPRVTLSFRVQQSPALIVRNPSGIPVLIEGRKVNVVTGAVEKKNVLVKDSVIRLW